MIKEKQIDSKEIHKRSLLMPCESLKRLYVERHNLIGKQFEECAANNGNWIELLAKEYEILSYR